MPQWVMDHACANVDATDAAAIRRDADGWRVCNAYCWRDPVSGLDDDDAYDDIEEARMVADRYNRERWILPLVIPASWAIVGAAK